MIDETHAAAAFSALGHPDRIRALRRLVQAAPAGLASGDLAGRLGMAPTRMSFHLTCLERAGLVRSWRVGRSIRYAPDFEALGRLLAYLTDDCCNGRPALCGGISLLTGGAGLARQGTPENTQ